MRQIRQSAGVCNKIRARDHHFKADYYKPDSSDLPVFFCLFFFTKLLKASKKKVL